MKWSAGTTNFPTYPQELYNQAKSNRKSSLTSSSVQSSHSIVSDPLRPHGLQHTRPPCPSPTPRVYSKSCPSSRWCHPTISSSVICFSCPQSSPASGSFQMSRFFTWGGQSIGVSASASVLARNIQDWSPLGWTGWISLLSKWLSRVSPTLQFKSNSSLVLNFLYMTSGKTIALTRRTLVGKVMSVLFTMLSRLVIAFLTRSKRLLISWQQSPSEVNLETRKNKVCHCFHCLPIYLPWSDGTRCHDLSFLNVEFLANIFTPLSLSSRGSLVPLHSAIRVVSSVYLRLLIFLLAILIPACASSTFAFCMMYSAYKLNKRSDNSHSLIKLLFPGQSFFWPFVF